mgnify:CR=1 FL=1
MGSMKTFSFGACNVSKYSPPKEKLSSETKVLNIAISFEDALKLNLSLDECIRKLNKYKRNSKAGQHCAVNLILHLTQDRISISEGKL